MEFALVAVLLFTLIFGIIGFGYLLSFKQDMTRAAAEGARAGAVAFPATNALTNSQAATKDAVSVSGKSCGSGSGNFTGTDSDNDGMACKVSLAPCVSAPGNCITVELVYNQKTHPLLGALPFVSKIMPDTLTSKSVAKVNS